MAEDQATLNQALVRAAGRRAVRQFPHYFSLGADVNSANVQGQTAFISALFDTRLNYLFDRMLAAGANILARDCNGINAIHMAATGHNAEIVLRLLALNPDFVNSTTNRGYTALHCVGPNAACARILLDAGANLAARDENGSEPWHSTAGWIEPLECFQVWLDAGANINAVNNMGRTPLHVATGTGGGYDNHIAVKWLIDHGATVDATDSMGQTPLMIAAASIKPECARVLLANNASATLQDVNGRSARDLCAPGSAVYDVIHNTAQAAPTLDDPEEHMDPATLGTPLLTCPVGLHYFGNVERGMERAIASKVCGHVLSASCWTRCFESNRQACRCPLCQRTVTRDDLLSLYLT